MKTLAELATSQNASFRGNGDIEISSVATLEKAQNHQISFLANPKYTTYLQSSNAGAVILSPEVAENYDGNALIADDPYLCFAYIAQIFQKQGLSTKSNMGIHDSASVDQSVQLDETVSVGAYSCVAENVTIGADTVIETHVSIGQAVKLGQACIIKSGVRIEAGSQLGDNVIVHPGAVIGADGFGLARGPSGWVKIPQTGTVRIGDDCEIGANTTIDRGAIEDTVLGHDVRLDNQIQIGHNVQIGDHTVMAGCTAVAGSAVIGKNCLIGGGVGIVGHINICDGVTIQAMALVTHTINEPGSYSSVPPLQPTKQWQRNAVRSKQLDKMARQVNQLEKKIND